MVEEGACTRRTRQCASAFLLTYLRAEVEFWIKTLEFEVGGFMEATTQPAKARRHYTRDLRDRVLYQHNILGKTTADIARDLDISLHIVQRTLQVWNEIGDVLQDPKDYSKRGRPTVMDPVACNVRLSLFGGMQMFTDTSST